MNHVLRMCAEYARLLAHPIHSFRPAGLHRTAGDPLSTEIACENVDEMLIAMPWASTIFGNAPDPTVAQPPQKMASPFGDW